MMPSDRWNGLAPFCFHNSYIVFSSLIFSPLKYEGAPLPTYKHLESYMKSVITLQFSGTMRRTIRQLFSETVVLKPLLLNVRVVLVVVCYCLFTEKYIFDVKM